MKIFKILLTGFLFTFLLSGCLYDFIVPEEVPPVDPDNPDNPTISYSETINPIFNNGNNCTSCHKTGSQLPDLTTDNSYKSINTSRYINDDVPEESKIYKHISPETTTHTQKKYTQTEAAAVLLWIHQGAKNN